MSDSVAQYHTVVVGYQKFYVDQRYINLKPIGDGSYGFVVSATDTLTGNKVAIKKVKDVFLDDFKHILREIKLMNHFDKHENIICIHDLMIVPPNKEHFDDIYIVTNLMESDLERIIRSRQLLTDQHHQYFVYQILRGLKYAHSANVLHRDLKPCAVLVNANCELAICDFYSAMNCDITDFLYESDRPINRWYRAPEMLLHCAQFGRPVDVWSLGCIFAELITQEPFFRGVNPQHQLQVIVAKLGLPSPEKLTNLQPGIPYTADQLAPGKNSNYIPPPFASWFPAKINPDALNLLQKMLQFCPEDRITVEEALAHPYLKDFHDQVPEPNCYRLFDFDFEKWKEMSEAEVRRLMFAEVCKFRPQKTESKDSTTVQSPPSNEEGES